MNVSILAGTVYIQSFVKFNNFIGNSFSKSKACIKTFAFNIHNTGVIFECFLNWVIAGWFSCDNQEYFWGQTTPKFRF